MSKGLYHCSRCKSHFYDAEATAMHIKDKHAGKGEVLRHPTKKELLIRDEQQRDRIAELEAEAAALVKAGLMRAAEAADTVAKSYDVLKADRKTYEPPRVQKAAKSMVRLASEDILALADDPNVVAEIIEQVKGKPDD